jgi:hypothetical protein
MSSGVALTAVVEAALRLKTTLAIPGDYEWLILSAPGLLTQAWWFKSQHTDKSDLVQPVLTALAELDSNRIYPATEFLSIGRSLATARLTFGEFRSDSA